MKKPRCISNAAGLYCGAGDRIRTGDIYLGKVVLYQLSYSRNEVIIARDPPPDKQNRDKPWLSIDALRDAWARIMEPTSSILAMGVRHANHSIDS